MILSVVIQVGEHSKDMAIGDWIAGLSLFIAVLALFSTIWSSFAQIKHNRLSAKPHLSIGVGSLDYFLRLTNHGPGVASIESYKGTIDGVSIDLLDPKGPHNLATILFRTLSGWPDTKFEVLNLGDSLSPGSMSVTISPMERLPQSDRDELVVALTRLRVDVTSKCVYGKTHKESFIGSAHT